MMEIIKWVITPPCRRCNAPPEFMRRISCFGCGKLYRKTAPSLTLKSWSANTDRRTRNARIVALRDADFSYGRIGQLLGLPRATVQSAEAAGRRDVEA